MRQSIYLHRYVADTLSYFGELSEVVDRILQAGADGKMELTGLPRSPGREGASRYDIIVTQPDYLALLQAFPPNSSQVSLRRILYYFVDNAIYEDLGWKVTSRPANKELQVIHNHADKARNSIERIAIRLKHDETVQSITQAIGKLITQIEEHISHG